MNGWTFSQKSLRVRKKPLPPLKLDIHTDVLVAHDNKTQHSRRSKKITTQFSSDQLNPMIDWIFGRIWGIIQQNTTQYRCKRKKRITQLTANQPKNPRPHNDLKNNKKKKCREWKDSKVGALATSSRRLFQLTMVFRNYVICSAVWHRVGKCTGPVWSADNSLLGRFVFAVDGD